MHIEPAEGLPCNVAEPVIDMLFPKAVKAAFLLLQLQVPMAKQLPQGLPRTLQNGP